MPQSRRAVFFSVMLLLAVTWLPATSHEEKKKKDYVEVREEVVVTATISPKPLKLCSRSVAVLRAGDLDALPSDSALSLLDNLAGVFVQRSGEFGRADPDIRGIGQNGRRVAVLVDGRPEKMGIFGCAVSHAFPLDNVEQVEVVRGPASVLYGGEALGGVIHIRTRLPRDGFENRVELGTGSYSTRNVNLRHGGVTGGLRYLVSYDHRASDGYRRGSAYSGDSATGRFSLALGGGGELFFHAKYFSGNKDEPGPLEFPTMEYSTLYRRGALDLGFRREGKKGNWEIRVYRNFGHHQFSDGWHSRDHTSGGWVHYTARNLEGHALTLGLDVRAFGGTSLGWPEGNWRKWEGAIFVNDDWIAGSRWVISGGFRLHRDSWFGLEGVPRLGVVFQAGRRITLRANISRGFRSPQLNELVVFPTANPDLEPESMWNLEAGVEAVLAPGLFLDASLFRMRGTHLIRLVAQAGSNPPFRFQNIDNFTFTGLEAGLRARLARGLTMGFQATFLDTGAWTRGRPGRKWNLDLRWASRRFQAFIQGQYVTDYHAGDRGEEPLPDYFLVNGRLVFRPVRGVDIRLDLLNLLDEDYLVYGEFPGVAAGRYPMPGRHFRLGVVLHFGQPRE